MLDGRHLENRKIVISPKLFGYFNKGCLKIQISKNPRWWTAAV